MASQGELYPPSIFDAYRKVMNLARDMNTYIQAPEIVFVGPANHQKSAIIEAFVGHSLFDTKGWTTKRPIHFKLLSNPECAQPRVTIKRDYSSKNFATDSRVELKELGAELQKRNSYSLVPLVVDFEYKDCWNLTLIDAPDLLLNGAESKGNPPEDLQQRVQDLMHPPHRIIVSVEESCDWGKGLMLDIVKEVDPKLDRSVFVYNKLQRQLKNFTETQPLNQFFSSTCQGNGDKAFFVDVLEESEPTFNLAKHVELTKATFELLEQLKFDRRYEAFIGIQALRKHLWDATWKIYQDNIPTVQNRLRALKSGSEQQLAQLKSRLSGMDIFRLRSAASNFVMNFLQSIEKLIVGTLDGNPAQNGQTLVEEKMFAGEWYDINGEVIDSTQWNIPYTDTRIYGGQQFERLLAEFRAVAENIQMNDIPLDDVATSAGPQKLNNVNALAWSASDLARRQSMKSFMPLIDQLVKRSVMIMQRLPDIALKMMANAKSKNRAGPTGGAPRASTLLNRTSSAFGQSQQPEFDIGTDEFPFFTHHVKDLYEGFISTIAEECRDKCMDEFYCTRLIYWENTKVSVPSSSSKKDVTSLDVKDTVQALAAKIFDSIRERITRNILLKCHNFFLAPMQSPLWGEIQSKVSVLSNEMLEEVFEVTQTTQRLKDEEKTLQLILDKFGQQESHFQAASHAFSHPVR